MSLSNVMKSRRNKSAFTLIEIMIVVLIIGILLAIAVPNFVRAREASRAKACTANLKQLDSAEEQWAMDKKLAAGGTAPQMTDLVGTAAYIKAEPKCPAGGTYTLNAIGTAPACSYNTTSGAASTDYNYHGI